MKKNTAVVELEKTQEVLDCLDDIERCCFSGEAWDTNMFLSAFENPFFFFYGIWQGKSLVAYCLLSAIADSADIGSIAVLPEFRGKGYAKLLMDKMLGIAKEKGAKHMTLEVNQQNEQAIGLYKVYGFRVIGARKNYYSDTIYPCRDAYIMQMELK